MTTYTNPANAAAISAATDQTAQCNTALALVATDETYRLYDSDGVTLRTTLTYTHSAISGTSELKIIPGTRLAETWTSNGPATIIARCDGGTEKMRGTVALTYPVKQFWPTQIGAISWRANTALPVGASGGGGGSISLPTTVILSADSLVTPSSAELVTFGLPLSYAENLTDTANLTFKVGGVAIPVFVQSKATWHTLGAAGRHRIVKVQCVLDMTAGDKVITVSKEARNTATDLTAASVTSGYFTHASPWNTSPSGASISSPRIIPLHDPSYISASGIIGPFAPPASDDVGCAQVRNLIPNQVRLMKYNASYGVTDSTYEGFLFDRVSTLGKLSAVQYVASERKELIRHCALSKRAYFNEINPSTGYWQWGSPPDQVSTNDGRYIYPEAAYTALWLLGDDTQWDNTLINLMATAQAASDTNAYGSAVGGFAGEFDAFTERNSGLSGTSQLYAWVLTGRTASKTEIDSRIGWLKAHQQNTKAWQTEPLSGAWTHDYYRHESNGVAWGTVTSVSGSTFVIDSAISGAALAALIGQQIQIGPDTLTLNSMTLIAADSRGGGTYTANVTPALSAAVPFQFVLNAGNIASWIPAHVHSSWMVCNVTRFLEEYQYHAGAHTDIPEMLRRAGVSLDEYAFVSASSTGSYTRKAQYIGQTPLGSTTTFNSDPTATYPLYLYHAAPDAAGLGRLDLELESKASQGAWNTDQHTLDLLQPLSAAYTIESDSTRKAKLLNRMQKIVAGTINADNPTRNGPLRLANWQHVGIGYRRYKALS